MRYYLCGFTYWPIWLGLWMLGYPLTGMIIGLIVACGGPWVLWRLELGTWRID